MDAQKEAGTYHCMSRVVGAAFLLDDVGKEVLRRQLWALAEYCGLEVITYAIMSNHYHVLVRVPQKHVIEDSRLLQAYRLLHPELNAWQERALAMVEQDMPKNGDLAQRWRSRQLRQMFDVSQFNKLLKMRFSIWYNKTHKRLGTLWSERFKSVLVEDGEALTTMAAYIDLNAVRAGIVSEPHLYRFCGYGEAVAGQSFARRGLGLLSPGSWSETSEYYRGILLGWMSAMREGEQALPEEAVKMEAQHELRLPIFVRVSSRVRFLADGLVLGSAAFVRQKAALVPGSRPREPRGLLLRGLSGALHIADRLLPPREGPAVVC